MRPAFRDVLSLNVVPLPENAIGYVLAERAGGPSLAAQQQWAVELPAAIDFAGIYNCSRCF